MKRDGVNRRQFVAGVATAAAAAALAGCDQQANQPKPVPQAYKYDISKLANDDGGLPRWKQFAVQPLEMLSAVELQPTAEGLAAAVGNQVILLNANGEKQGDWTAPEPIHAMCVVNDTFYVAGRSAIHACDAKGKTIETRQLGGKASHFTSIAVSGDNLYVANAGAKTVTRHLAGDPVYRLEGFHVPSPYFDVALGDDDTLWVAHTGKHRLERYSGTGELQGHWGKPSMKIDGFCGCCNPCHFIRLPNGQFVTCEKGLHRVKLYSTGGKPIAVIATAKMLGIEVNTPAPNPGETAVPGGPIVASAGEGRVAVLHPKTGSLHLFAPEA